MTKKIKKHAKDKYSYAKRAIASFLMVAYFSSGVCNAAGNCLKDWVCAQEYESANFVGQWLEPAESIYLDTALSHHAIRPVWLKHAKKVLFNNTSVSCEASYGIASFLDKFPETKLSLSVFGMQKLREILERDFNNKPHLLKAVTRLALSWGELMMLNEVELSLIDQSFPNLEILSLGKVGGFNKNFFSREKFKSLKRLEMKSHIENERNAFAYDLAQERPVLNLGIPVRIEEGCSLEQFREIISRFPQIASLYIEHLVEFAELLKQIDTSLNPFVEVTSIELELIHGSADEALHTIASRCPKLKMLEIPIYNNVTKDAFLPGESPDLRSLHITDYVKDEMLLAIIEAYPRLEKLHIHARQRLQGRYALGTLEKFAKLPNLFELSIRCSYMTNESLSIIIKACPELKLIKLINEPNIRIRKHHHRRFVINYPSKKIDINWFDPQLKEEDGVSLFGEYAFLKRNRFGGWFLH